MEKSSEWVKYAFFGGILVLVAIAGWFFILREVEEKVTLEEAVVVGTEDEVEETPQSFPKKGVFELEKNALGLIDFSTGNNADLLNVETLEWTEFPFTEFEGDWDSINKWYDTTSRGIEWPRERYYPEDSKAFFGHRFYSVGEGKYLVVYQIDGSIEGFASEKGFDPEMIESLRKGISVSFQTVNGLDVVSFERLYTPEAEREVPLPEELSEFDMRSW